MSGMTLAQIAQQYAQQPERTAIVFKDRQISYANLNQSANQVAHGLTKLDVQPQDRILFLDVNNDRFYEVAIGSSRIGAVIVPIHAKFVLNEILPIIQDSQAKVLFIGRVFYTAIGEQLQALLGDTFTIICTDEQYEIWRDHQSINPIDYQQDTREICLQLYTSGTTGVSKGVELCSLSLFHTALDAKQNHGLSPLAQFHSEDHVLLSLPHAHIAGSLAGLFALYLGCKLVLVEQFNPQNVLQIMQQEQVSLTLLVPVMLKHLLDTLSENNQALNTLKNVIYGAAPMPTTLLKAAIKRLPHTHFGQIYGLTESSGPITYLDAQDHLDIAQGNDRLSHSCGRATHGVEIQILNEKFEQLLSGQIGEIACRSIQNMNGYWQKPTETSQTFYNEYLLTGDLGYMDEQGYLYIYDRKKDMVISGGENVYPTEIEDILYQHPNISEVAVIGVPDETWGECLKAIIVLKNNNQDVASIAQNILEFSKSKLANFKVPKSIDFVEQLPRNPAGKVLRRILREPYWSKQDRQVS